MDLPMFMNLQWFSGWWLQSIWKILVKLDHLPGYCKVKNTNCLKQPPSSIYTCQPATDFIKDEHLTKTTFWAQLPPRLPFWTVWFLSDNDPVLVVNQEIGELPILSHWVSGKFINHTAFDPLPGPWTEFTTATVCSHCSLGSCISTLPGAWENRIRILRSVHWLHQLLLVQLDVIMLYYITGNLSNKMRHAGWILSVTCNFCRLFRANFHGRQHQGWGNSQAKEGKQMHRDITVTWITTIYGLQTKTNRGDFNKCCSCITETRKATKQQQKKAT